MEEFTKIIKNLFREKINIVIFLLTILLLVNIYGFVYYNMHFTKIRKKIDHRYFNITRSLEDIHNVEIDTYKGEIKPTRN